MVLAMVLAGGLGAALRFAVDSTVKQLLPTRFPLGTALINLVGSFVLGLLLGLHARHGLGAGVLLVVGTGLLGGFTTMSTASVEVVRLLRLRAWFTGLAYLLGGAAACVAAGTLGWLLV